mmetsp:Transcript_21194/g.42627  ORF Transcript_21194/g.42627 Transcript_21194/m.42627 type:complete len:102 (+) Transcript_21194:852-1157(+)
MPSLPEGLYIEAQHDGTYPDAHPEETVRMRLLRQAIQPQEQLQSAHDADSYPTVEVSLQDLRGKEGVLEKRSVPAPHEERPRSPYTLRPYLILIDILRLRA